jgi:hypothetical protein
VVIDYSKFCDAGMICLGGHFYFPATQDDPRAITVACQCVRPATDFELLRVTPTACGAIPESMVAFASIQLKGKS